MDLPRAVYSRDLKIAAMRALDAGSTTGEIARKYQVSPHLLERWRGPRSIEAGPAQTGHLTQRIHGLAFRRGVFDFLEHTSAPLTTAGG